MPRLLSASVVTFCMVVSGGGFEQAYNAQASVDTETMLIVGNHVSQNPNDKQEVEPALVELDQLPESLGKVEKQLIHLIKM